MTDYAVKVTVRNGRILRLMRAAGVDTQADLACLAGLTIATVNSLVTLRRSPTTKNGEWAYGVIEIAGVLQCDPEDMFSCKQRTLALRTNNHEVYMDEARLGQITGGDPEQSTWAKIEAERLLSNLSDPRQLRIVEAITDGRTLRDVGESEGVSVERIRQIYMQGLRKMRSAATRASRGVEREILLAD